MVKGDKACILSITLFSRSIKNAYLDPSCYRLVLFSLKGDCSILQYVAQVIALDMTVRK